jgi:hypothetical protein
LFVENALASKEWSFEQYNRANFNRLRFGMPFGNRIELIGGRQDEI